MTLKPGTTQKNQSGSGQPNETADRIETIAHNLAKQTDTVNKSSLAEPETMLANQAKALDGLFVRLAQIGMDQKDQSKFDYLALALQAQDQCRATLETLAGMKPRLKPAIAKQTNNGQLPKKADLLLPKMPTIKQLAMLH